MNDTAMEQSVYSVLLRYFLTTDSTADTQTLAASMIAVNKLNNAWKELRNISSIKDNQEVSSKQIGL